MTTSTCSAAATGLPALMPILGRPTPRRGFLAGLASLPLLGGGAAPMGGHGSGGSGPDKAPGADRQAGLDDYAAASFKALEVNLDQAREAHQNMWTPLAIGLQLMTKSPSQCRDFAASLEDNSDVIEALMSSLKDGAEWYRQAAEILESAEIRYLAGAARFIKEEGLDA